MNPPHDRFDLGVRALRESTEEPSDGRASRDAILGRLARREQRQRGYKLLGIAAALLLVIPAARAGWNHWKAPLRASAPVPVPPTKPAIALALVESVTRASVPDPMPGPSMSQPSPRQVPQRRASTPSELDLYGRAHRLHFHSESPRAALRAWTVYVELYPGGRFFPEAQFNRAVCLVRIGDLARAREALTQVVEHSPADYQRAQAERLLAQFAGP